jgi:hypothetical protein
VVDPGPTIEARGRNYKWVLGQVATFLGRISVDSYIADAILDRDKPVRRTLRYDNGTLTLRRRPKTAARA